MDAALFRASHDAVLTEDSDLIGWALERGDTMRATRELGVEAEGQGARLSGGGCQVHGRHRGWTGLQARATALARPVVYPVCGRGLRRPRIRSRFLWR